MNVDDILSLWESDSRIDQTELGRESLRISELHCKYYKIFVGERLLKRKLDSDFKELKLAKHEFYLHGPSPETQAKGWAPTQARVLRQDTPTYLDGDPHLVELSLKVGYQQEKIDLLESIIKMISNRNFVVKNAIDFLKFTNGV